MASKRGLWDSTKDAEEAGTDNGGVEHAAVRRRVGGHEEAAGISAGDGTEEGDAPMLWAPHTKQTTAEDPRSRHCPYLDTVNRPLLDFDFERVCSVTLSNLNVYGCLVCGKFFQGRGQHTEAYTHSLQFSHHVFINLSNEKVYCLPDNYEVIDSTLDDVKFALNPKFTRAEVAALNTNTILSSDVLGVMYLPGFVGLNNLKATDFVNVVMQSLCHVTPLRNFFLEHHNTALCTSDLVQQFGALFRKMWSPANFKSTVSPHEFIQSVSSASGKRFKIGSQADVFEFLSWLLNQLHRDLVKAYSKAPGAQKPPMASGSAKPGSSIVHDCFQGFVEVFCERMTPLTKDELAEERKKAAAANTSLELEYNEDTQAVIKIERSTTQVPFLMLTLDLPASPLFQDEAGATKLPEVQLFNLLKKFDGVTVTETLRGEIRERKTYRLLSLPPFLLLHVKRFTKNIWFMEKNPTIVRFPLTNLDISEYGTVGDAKVADLPTDSAIDSMSVSELRTLGHSFGATLEGAVEKSELVTAVKAAVAVRRRAALAKYNMIANIVHDNPADRANAKNPLAEGSYRAYVHHEGAAKWYEMQDLHVSEKLAQEVNVSESYVMLYGQCTPESM